jgi:hypothetical protein
VLEATDPTDSSSEIVTTNQEQRLGWGRVLFEPGLVFAAHERLGIGAGIGLGFSFPFRRSNTLATDALNFIYSPSLDGRFYVKKYVALMLQFRGVFGEKAFINPADPPVSDTTDGNGTANDPPETTGTGNEPRQEDARSLLTLFGVVFNF